MVEIILAALLGLATTSSAMIGVALGLYVPLSKRLLGCILAFASGGLISALAIELAFNGAVELNHLGFGVGAAWSLVGSGFAIGAIIYSAFSRYPIFRPRRSRQFSLACAPAGWSPGRSFLAPAIPEMPSISSRAAKSKYWKVTCPSPA